MRMIYWLLMAGVLFAADTKKEAQGGGICTPPVDKASPSLPAVLMAEMGDVHMAITTSNAPAQKFFDQGLAQMHSFWAREAERSFLQAAELDPDRLISSRMIAASVIPRPEPPYSSGMRAAR